MSHKSGVNVHFSVTGLACSRNPSLGGDKDSRNFGCDFPTQSSAFLQEVIFFTASDQSERPKAPRAQNVHFNCLNPNFVFATHSSFFPTNCQLYQFGHTLFVKVAVATFQLGADVTGDTGRVTCGETYRSLSAFCQYR